MNEENNLGEPELKKASEKPFQKGWNNLINGIKGGFDKFQQSLEEQSKKNKELWEDNKGKVNEFFKDMKEDWEKKIKKWNEDMEKTRIESKEQWETYKNKVSQDFKNFQEKAKEDWNDGLKSFRKGFFKAYFWFLVLTIPILIIVIVVLWILSQLTG